MRDRHFWIGIFIIAAGITFLVLADVFTDLGGLQGHQIVSLVTALALLVVIGGGAIGSYQGRGTMMLQHVAIWLGLVAVIVLIYNYRDVLGFSIG